MPVPSLSLSLLSLSLFSPAPSLSPSLLSQSLLPLFSLPSLSLSLLLLLLLLSRHLRLRGQPLCPAALPLRLRIL